ncbi:hypothetical protein RRSWK_04918 [Rhodopirellula sp. SWK7]|nr:hypothetical protein RRSWK_04918 [Rhodopirellula sp. SWK7]
MRFRHVDNSLIFVSVSANGPCHRDHDKSISLDQTGPKIAPVESCQEFETRRRFKFKAR